MSLEVFQACVQGYSDHLFDLQVLGAQQGYWAGYYGRSKKPKPLQTILDKMLKSKKKNERVNRPSAAKPDVDVEAFLAMEAKFQQRMKQ